MICIRDESVSILYVDRWLSYPFMEDVMEDARRRTCSQTGSPVGVGQEIPPAWRCMKGDDDEEVDALGNMRLDSVCPLVRLFFALCFCGNRDADVYSDADSLCRLDELLEPVIKHIKERTINFSCW